MHNVVKLQKLSKSQSKPPTPIKVLEVNAPETHKQSMTMLNLAMIPIIEKKGNGVFIHDTKSLNAQGKIQSKGTVLLLLFFFSKSQRGRQHGAKAYLTASSRRPLAPV